MTVWFWKKWCADFWWSSLVVCLSMCACCIAKVWLSTNSSKPLPISPSTRSPNPAGASTQGWQSIRHREEDPARALDSNTVWFSLSGLQSSSWLYTHVRFYHLRPRNAKRYEKKDAKTTLPADGQKTPKKRTGDQEGNETAKKPKAAKKAKRS
jgi:hypothetical protein